MKTLRFILFAIILIEGFAMSCQASKKQGYDIRSPAVAGQFYPASASMLKLAVDKFLQDAIPPQTKNPIAIVVPHAGYIFSGQICADAYKQVNDQQYDLVVILGTNHTSATFRKISLYSGDGFQTPLGVAWIDKELVSALQAENSDFVADKSLHEREHSIEVQVPFIQSLFPNAKILPIVVSIADIDLCTRFGLALAKVLKGRHALIVASSDLSHYPKAEDASLADRQTLEAIITLDPAKLHTVIRSQMHRNIPNLSTCACGEAPIMSAMVAAKSLGATGGKIISYTHSGEVAVGEGSRVVGYGAVVLTAGHKEEKMKKDSDKILPTSSNDQLQPSDKKALLAFARETITRYLTTNTVPLARGFSPILQEPRGVFVTLKKGGQLRGCIGQMIPNRPLSALVGAMALQSAFEDPRFRPVTIEEVPKLEIEISVLTPMKSVSGVDDIMVGRDGVVIRKSGRSAVYLPQVATEQGWNREEMLDSLCLKAGLPEKSWKEGAQFFTFQAIVFGEEDFK